MNSQILNLSRSQSSSSSSLNSKELSCGGQPCHKCGACRDWYRTRNGHDVLKRANTSCNCSFMFSHELVSHPDHSEHEYYPLQNLICMCKDNC